MLSADELDPMVLSPVVLRPVVLGSDELDPVELGPTVLSSLVLAPVVPSSMELCPDELASVDVGPRDVDSVEICSLELASEVLASVELGPPLLGSVDLDSTDVDSDASEDADAVGSNELEDSVSEAVKLRELEEDSEYEALVRDDASELAGRELVAPGELDCVPVVSGALEVVRNSLAELLEICSLEDDATLLSALELGFRLSDSLPPLLVCSSEEADDARLLGSDVLASGVEKGSLVLVVSTGPDEVLDSTSLD